MVAKEILIIDDDKTLCKVMSLAFQDRGFKTYVAYHGDAGLELYAQTHPPAILLDVAMPGMDGFQVAAEIRKLQPADTHPLIVIMTATSRSFFVSKEFDIGIDGYLTKPIVSTEVVKYVMGLMNPED